MKIHQIKKASRQYLKGNVKKSAVLLIYIILNVAVLTTVPYLLNNYVSSFTGILAACAAVLVLNLFSYSTFMTGRSAWFLFYKKKKRLLKTIYWFSPSRLSKSLGTYLSLLVRKAALASAFLLPGAAISVSAVILALNGGVEFNLFVSWIAGGGVILIAGAVFMMIVIQRYFLVPSIREVCRPASRTPGIGCSSESLSRSAAGRFVISEYSVTCFSCSHEKSCFARKAGWPSSRSSSSSSVL